MVTGNIEEGVKFRMAIAISQANELKLLLRDSIQPVDFVVFFNLILRKLRICQAVETPTGVTDANVLSVSTPQTLYVLIVEEDSLRSLTHLKP